MATVSHIFPAYRALLRRLLLVAVLAGLLACFALQPAFAQKMTLSDLVLDNKGGGVSVRFKVDFEPVEEVAAILQDGATLALRCEAQLSRQRGWWLDKSLAEAERRDLLYGNAIAKEFVVEQESRLTLRERDLKVLLRKAWGNIAMDLGPFSRLERGATYIINLTVSLKQADVPAWMRWTLFFRSWEAVPTAKYQMVFEY